MGGLFVGGLLNGWLLHEGVIAAFEAAMMRWKQTCPTHCSSSQGSSLAQHLAGHRLPGGIRPAGLNSALPLNLVPAPPSCLQPNSPIPSQRFYTAANFPQQQ